MEAATLRRVDLGIGGNEAAARELSRKGVANVCVLPQLGVDPGRFRLEEKPVDRTLTIGYAGRLVPEKGVDFLIHAVAALEGEWRLRVLGKGPEEGALRALAEKLAVSDRIEFLPEVPHAEVAEYMRSLGVLVLPSRTTESWAEQFGHVLIEAMSSAVPVVASTSGSIPEVIGDAGLLFPEGDAESLRTSLERVREEPGLAERLGQTGRRRVLERYTWERIADETLRHYRELLEGEIPPAAGIGEEGRVPEPGSAEVRER